MGVGAPGATPSLRERRMNTNDKQTPAAARRVVAPLSALLLGGLLAPAAYSANTTTSLKRMSIESLMQVEVYSASRQLETTQSSASASYVVTGAAIARMGVTNVPDALRIVPGVQVGRVDANKWAVSMRGFNSRDANRLLVLVDGRSIYDPLFSGTLWEAHDFVMSDLDRIEVIRGPGGTLWGANAFNGVINIVTRPASETQGLRLQASTGTDDPWIASARLGFETGDGQHARVYLKGYDRDAGYATPDPAHDESRGRRGGFRWDADRGGPDTFTVSGDVYETNAGVRETTQQVQDVEHRGHNALARWTRRHGDGAALQVQAYFDHVKYDSIGFTQARDTWDLEVQHRLPLGARHQVVWGGGFRQLSDSTSTFLPGLVDVLPARRNDDFVNAFVQDTIAVLPERLSLIAGLKYEKTGFAPSEWLPNLRLSWTPDPDRTIWAAVSEATRVPSRLEADLTFLGSIRTGELFGPEHVRNHEIGWRQLLREEVWLDVVFFHSSYTDLRTGDDGGLIGNGMYGRARGVEMAVRWEPHALLRVDAAWTWLDSDLALEPGHGTLFQVRQHEGLAPRNQASIRTAWDLPRGARLDATLRHVGRLPAFGFDAYTELDLAAHLPLGRDFEISLIGRDLLHDHHWEQGFATSATGMSSQVRRSAMARLTWIPGSR